MNPNRQIDITSDTCPMTFVRTKLALEQMKPGEILAVLLNGDEPLRNVPRAVQDHGHAILGQTKSDGETYTLFIEVR